MMPRGIRRPFAGHLGHLKRDPTITSKVYAGLVKISHPMAVADLNDLVAKGIIRKVGKTRGAYYELAEEFNNII
jgi:Fic family protein